MSETRRTADVPRMLEALGIQFQEHASDEIWAPCPSHRETKASWSIRWSPTDPHNGYHHCFGCGFEGGPIELVTKVIGFSRRAAFDWLDKHGLWLESVVPLNVELVSIGREKIGLRVPSGLVRKPLAKWPTPVRRYAQARGIIAEQVDRWDIMYATDGPMNGRLFFPVVDDANRMVGWHARTYCDQDKRYKNASLADGYDPGSIFGMRYWPYETARGVSTLVVTEGTINALAFERAGARYIASLGGSEVHPRQLLKLAQWRVLLVASDPDTAGDKMYAAIRHSVARRLDSTGAPLVVVHRLEFDPGTDAQMLPVERLREMLDGATKLPS